MVLTQSFSFKIIFQFHLFQVIEKYLFSKVYFKKFRIYFLL